MPEGLTLPIVIAAALADSINPCVIGVLVFLIAFMLRVFKSPRRMLLFGLLYTFVVYATYLLLGFGILKVALNVGLASAFYWVAALVAIIAGFLEIKDFFWYGKGLTLQIIPGGADRLKHYVQYLETAEQKHPLLLVATTMFLGVFVVMIELPCTGAPYLAILGLLSAGEFAAAVPLLLLYNLIFVLPLLVIIGLAYGGRSLEAMEEWRKKHRGLMRLGMGTFLIALGFYMIYSLNPIF